MKKTSILAVKVAGAGALALLLAASAFAEGRPQDRTWRDGDRRGDREERRDDRWERRSGSHRQYRDDERVRSQGRIRRYARERGGYRLWLDTAPHAFWVPEAHWRRDWRVGVHVDIGGVFRGGTVYSDAYGDRYGDRYDDRYDRRDDRDSVRGYVDRVDYRRETLVLRDLRTGRAIAVDMRAADHGRSRLDLRDIRRGDRVTLVGHWNRRDVFAARGIDAVDSGRY